MVDADDDTETGAKGALERMNALLAAEDDRLSADHEAPRWPVTFIVATPRSASTLFQQLALSTMRIGYVSNVMARFWRAPVLGAVLARDLDDPDYVSHLKSHGTYYNAPGAQEPHEWGWFWRHWLRLEGDDHYCDPARPIDGAGLCRKLAAVEAVKDAPLVFDNVFAMANLDVLRAALPRVLAVRIRRDPYFVCNSILNARIDRYGDVGAFFSHRPRAIEAILAVADPVEQVVQQVRAIVDEIADSLTPMAPADVLSVEYPDIIGAPQAVMRRFAAFLAGHGAPVEMRAALPDFPQLRNRNTAAFVRPELKERLDAAFAEAFR